MSQELTVLTLTAVSVAFLHTVFGPDHYLPFIVMSKAGKWSTTKTTWITILCGIGHVGSSVILGFVGIAFGVALTSIQGLESLRGSIAGWILIAFGFAYFLWGMRRAYRNQPHTHWHPHANGSTHTHSHTHAEEHVHVHGETAKPSMTPWILFTIFVFGPCEPLIPILIYPAAQGHMFNVAVVSIVFGIITIGVMLTIVLTAASGLRLVPTKHVERYSHALAGAAVLLCGVAVQFFGL